MKILLISLVLFFTNITEEKWKTLTDTTGKYTVEYPADWEVQEIGDRKALTTLLDDTNDTFAENINVISIPFVKTDVSQPAFEKGMVDQLKTQFKTFKYLGSTV